MRSILIKFILLFFAAPAALGLGSQTTAISDNSSRCSISYRIEVQNGAKNAFNTGTATIGCEYRAFTSSSEVQIFAMNAEAWPSQSLPYIEEASITALGPDISSLNLISSLIRSSIIRDPPQYSQFLDSQILFSSVLRSEGVHRGEMSVAVLMGNLEGYALKRGYNEWIIYNRSAGAEYNRDRINMSEQCNRLTLVELNIPQCFSIRQN
jgi:hypothetical protein